MTPIFPPRSNTFARLSILVALIGLTVVVGLLAWYLHSSTFTKVGVKIDQPVPFPHNLHITAVGLNCRYCHDSVDRSSFAGIPPTETCMSCHSQIATNRPSLAPVRESWENGTPIQWNRVNDLPDFVFFDHSIHVNKGVGCETCHGRVDTMTTDVKEHSFYMMWCLDCHKAPQKYLRPKDQVYTMGFVPSENQIALGERLVQEYNVMPSQQLINCSICHR